MNKGSPDVNASWEIKEIGLGGVFFPNHTCSKGKTAIERGENAAFFGKCAYCDAPFNDEVMRFHINLLNPVVIRFFFEYCPMAEAYVNSLHKGR